MGIMDIGLRVHRDPGFLSKLRRASMVDCAGATPPHSLECSELLGLGREDGSIHTYVCVYEYLCIYIYIYIYVCVYVCASVYICI